MVQTIKRFMSSKKLGICLDICLSNTFQKIGSILISLKFSFKLLLNFLCNGVTSACFKHDGKIVDFMELLIILKMKFENISEFSLIILLGISAYWDALVSFNSLISVSISLSLTSLKLKAPFLLDLVLIARMLGCFLYLRIAFKVESLTFSLIGSKSKCWEMLTFLTILPKKC